MEREPFTGFSGGLTVRLGEAAVSNKLTLRSSSLKGTKHMRPTIALTILLALPLAGCDWLDRAEGKNPNREYIERLALLETQFAARSDTPAVPEPVIAPVEVAAVQPVAVPPPVVQPEPAPVVVEEPPTPAVCVAIFRVLSCLDDGSFHWL